MSGSEAEPIEKEAIVIGAGISGLATAKCLLEDGLDVMLLEKSTDIGGLWKYKRDDYGVMSFTHINVSKYNYCFSDFPLPESGPEYPHHAELLQYINDYAQHFGLFQLIRFSVKVCSIDRMGNKWRLECQRMEADGKTPVPNSSMTFMCSYLAIASGHHAKPVLPSFKGEDSFPGEIIHSVDYKDAATNKFLGQRVLVVGIGNSAVDVAVDCAVGKRCPNVCISSRSGAWVFQNYILGHPADVYISRFFLALPMWAKNLVMETIMKAIQGYPHRWGLHPKMRIMQTQPTVSPTLIHHLQRKNIKIVPNIKYIEGSTVHFSNGSSGDFDKIVYCTGYKIDLPFLSDSVRKDIYTEGNNEIKLYMNVFAPSLGASLAFIGFAQPASGGLITMSEIQARWFSALCKGRVSLPERRDMEAHIEQELTESRHRWFKSGRHTIQRDPLTYTDEIASLIGAKPDLLSNPKLIMHMLFGSGGNYQWRLKGPHKWPGATGAIKKIPIPGLNKLIAYLCLLLVLGFFYCLYQVTVGVRASFGAGANV